MRRLLSAALISALLVPAAQAASLELKLNDEMAELEYAAPTGAMGLSGGEWGAGLLFNEDDDVVGTLSLRSLNRVSEALKFAVGFRGYLGNLDVPDEDLSSVAIGASVALSLAAQIPVSIGLSGYLAPDILTFGDAEGLREVALRVEAQLTPTAAVFVGYRELSVEFPGGDYEVDDGGHLGVRLGF